MQVKEVNFFGEECQYVMSGSGSSACFCFVEFCASFSAKKQNCAVCFHCGCCVVVLCSCVQTMAMCSYGIASAEQCSMCCMATSPSSTASKVSFLLFSVSNSCVICILDLSCTGHPTLCCLATAGIESNVKLWEPLSDLTALSASSASARFESILKRNQERVCSFSLSRSFFLSSFFHSFPLFLFKHAGTAEFVREHQCAGSAEDVAAQLAHAIHGAG